MTRLYDRIGGAYSHARRPDPFIQDQINKQIGSPDSVVNIGAGTGSYEPPGITTAAVDASITMLKQRDADAAQSILALAEALPFQSDAFSVAMSVLSCHHWRSMQTAFSEMRRVARDRIVFVTWDPAHEGFWLTEDYFPDILTLDRKNFPRLNEFERAFGDIEVVPLMIPHDCKDGFLGAYWRRPEAYLDRSVRGGMSTFGRIDSSAIADGLQRLEMDLKTGQWKKKYGDLMERSNCDLGYRIVTAE